MVRSMHHREEKQQKRNRMILGILITVIMIGSTIGYFVGQQNSNNNGLEYKAKNGNIYSFDQVNGKLYTTINGKGLSFYSHPLDAMQLNISDDAIRLINDSQIVLLTFDPQNNNDIQYIEQSRFDMENDFAGLKKYLITGVEKNTSGYESFKTITCKNSTAQVPVIEFVSSNSTETRGYVNNSCIIFEGKRTDFLKFRDYIVYKLYGVI